MGIVVGEAFEDYGNTMEYTVGAVRAFERLSGDRVRVYITEEKGTRHVLVYTFVAPVSAFADFGKKCFEIAEGEYALPEWATTRVSEFAS